VEVYILCESYWGPEGGGDTILGVYSDFAVAKKKAEEIGKKRGYTEECDPAYLLTGTYEISKTEYAVSGESIIVNPYWIDSDQYLNGGI
jgi:hypothetical protein